MLLPLGKEQRKLLETPASAYLGWDTIGMAMELKRGPI